MTQNSNKVMTGRDLVALVAANADVSQKDVKAVLEALGIIAINGLKNGTYIRLPALGTLTTKY